MRIVLIGLILLLVGGAVQAASEIMLYDGDASRDRGGVRFESWGSGFVSETTTAHYIGPQVLRILSQGYYQAAVIKFNDPAPLKDFIGNPNAYLEMWLKPSVVTSSAPVGGTTATLTGKASFLLSHLKIILLTDKGEIVAEAWPVGTENLAPGAWKKVAIPLAAFKSVQIEPATMLQGLQISANRADVFYLGQMRLLVDDGPMKIQISFNPTRPTSGQRITFKASLDAGAAATLVSWDFDNEDGLQIQAQGDVVEWIYRKAGTYVITATVTDEFGDKAPVSATTMVMVNVAAQE
jgi:chitodextrinase